MKGSIFDTMTFFVVIVVFGIVALIAVFILGQLNAGLVDTGLIDGTGAEILTDSTSRAPSVFDGAVITLLIVSWIYMLISGYLLSTNPAFLVVGLFFGFVILIFIAPISNVFLSISGMSDFSDASDAMPISNFIFNNALVFVIAMVTSVLISTYAGYRNGGIGL